MKTIKISPGQHFRDILKILNIDLGDESLQFFLPDIPSIVQAEVAFIEQNGIWGERILTFGKLAHLANLDSGEPKNYLSRNGRLLIMEELLQIISKEFNYFIHINNTREFSDSVLKLIAELKHSGINHEIFTDITSRSCPDMVRSKLQDFSRIYTEYSGYMENYRYIDDIDSLKLLSEYIEKGLFRKLFPETKRIVFYGFNDYTDSQIKVIEAISGNGIKVDVIEYENNTGLSADAIYVFGFQTVIEEVQDCAKQLSRLLYTDDINPSDIAVIINSPYEYSNIIHSEFRKAGINYSQSASLPLVSSFIGKLISELLLTKISGFRKQHLFNFLRNPYILRLSEYSDRIYRDIALFELNSHKKRVVQGMECWKGLLGDVTRPYSKDFTRILNEILGFIDNNFKSKKISRLNQDLIGFLNKFVYEKIRNKNSADSLPEYNALVSSFDLLKEYDFLIKKTFRDRNTDNLTHYLRLITDLLSEQRYSLTSEHRNDRVKVLSMPEARGTSFEYIFILGAGENRIPNPVRHDPIIKDHERSVLNGGIKKNILKTAKEIVESEIELFINTVRSGKKTSISFVNLDLKGLPLQPAYPVEDIYNNSKDKIINDLVSPRDFEEPYTEADLFNNIYKARLYDDDILNKLLPPEYKYCGYGITSELKRLRRIASLSEFEGLIKPVPGLSDRNSFTVTELETYGDCPFKYYASRILKLEFPGEPTDEPQPLDLGSLYHEIIYKFFYELSLDNNDKLDLRNKSDNEIRTKVTSTLQSLNLDNKFPWISDHRRRLLINRIKNHIIPSFILIESGRIRDYNTKGIYPVYFEKELEYEIDENTVIKGKSDRVDISSDQALVIDYKFGSVTNRKFSDYRNLQLPMYLLALNTLNLDSLGGYYRSVEKTDQEKGMEFTSKNFDEEINKASEHARVYIKNIKSGNFPADPNEKRNESDNSLIEIKKKREAPCIYCEYTDLCRANKRVFRKDVYEV